MGIFEDRVYVSKLIRQVLISQICVREAVLNFPHDSEDKSIKAAYHALVHFEADEDLRRKDDIYREEQDDYLEYISQALERGENLPENIIKNYEKFYSSDSIPHKKNIKGFLKSFFRFLNVENKE